MTLLEAAKAVVKWEGEFRAFLKGEYGVTISAADEEDHNVSNLFSAIRALRAAIEQGEWISVEDRLPEDDTRTLIVGHVPGRPACVLVGRHHGEKWFDRETQQIPYVTHWQPLPAPPEVKP